MRKVSFRPRAWKDVQESAEYLATEASDEIAERFLDSVMNLAHTLVRTPHIGSPCSFRNLLLRRVRGLPVTGFENWLIFYQATDERIDIIRVLHGARDISAIFDQDSGLS